MAFSPEQRIPLGKTGLAVSPICFGTSGIGDMPETIMGVVRDGDVVMTMGAGSISGVPAKLTNYPKV